jgi:hypothetical protein
MVMEEIFLELIEYYNVRVLIFYNVFNPFKVNTRAMSRRQNELIAKFKMAAGDVISIRG